MGPRSTSPRAGDGSSRTSPRDRRGAHPIASAHSRGAGRARGLRCTSVAVRCDPANDWPRSLRRAMPRRAERSAESSAARPSSILAPSPPSAAGAPSMHRPTVRGKSAPLLLDLFVEVQRCGIDAVPQAGRLGTVVEQVSEVPATLRAMHLSAPHEEAAIVLCTDVPLLDRLEKAGPPGPRLELCRRVE